MRFIGDIHGKFIKYQEIIRNCNKSVQIGDLGFKYTHDLFLENVNYNKHKVLFGNHDYYPYINKKHSLGRYKYDIENKILYISGAYSIDRQFRIEGKDWFKDEELNMYDFYKIVDCIENEQVDIIVSHDCPQIIRESKFNIKDKTTTSLGLQMIYEIIQPYIWIYGHHHKSLKYTDCFTEFICLNECEYFDIKI